MASILLQAFLYFDIFVIGILATLAFRHARAHYRPTKVAGQDETPHLSEEAKHRLLMNSEAEYQRALENSVAILQKDLEYSAQQINGLVTRFAGVIVGDEMEKYRAGLAKLHQQAEADMGGVRQEIAGHQAEIEAKFAAELDLEKQKLIKQIDLKLGDAVASFLLETLQHNVDLGSQGEYLMNLLEENKAVFKQEVAGGQAELKQ